MAEAAPRAAPVLVLGLGNPYRGDDGAGRAAAHALRSTLGARAVVAECDGEVTDLLGWLAQASAAVIIDACASGAPPGTLRRFDVTAQSLPHRAFSVSSHGLGLHDAIELARALGQLPRPCIIYAIEGADFTAGAAITPAVAAAATELAGQIQAELARLHAPEDQRDA